MSGSLNKVMLIGRLGKDPELRQSNSGTSVVNFTMATSERYKEQGASEWTEKTEWHRCVCFGSRAEVIAKYLKKGSPVYVEGGLQTRSWDDKDGQKKYSTEVVVRDFQFLDGPGDRGGSGGERSGGGGGYNKGPRSGGSQGGAGDNFAPASSSVADEDIPF